MKLKVIIIGLMLAGLILVAGCTSKASNLPETKVTVFKSMQCGCCEMYVQYLEKQDFDLTINNLDNLDAIKDQNEIPKSMRSCHTAIIGDYFVEGHVPIEAIEKLLTEKPDIAGISLPGMESGTPGMPGAKQGSWVVYAINHDGTTSEFITV